MMIIILDLICRKYVLSLIDLALWICLSNWITSATGQLSSINSIFFLENKIYNKWGIINLIRSIYKRWAAILFNY